MKADTRARSLPALSAGLWEWEYGLGGGVDYRNSFGGGGLSGACSEVKRNKEGFTSVFFSFIFFSLLSIFSNIVVVINW